MCLLSVITKIKQKYYNKKIQLNELNKYQKNTHFKKSNDTNSINLKQQSEISKDIILLKIVNIIKYNIPNYISDTESDDCSENDYSENDCSENDCSESDFSENDCSENDDISDDDMSGFSIPYSNYETRDLINSNKLVNSTHEYNPYKNLSKSYSDISEFYKNPLINSMQSLSYKKNESLVTHGIYNIKNKNSYNVNLLRRIY
jgi:hypothetical protein